MKLKKITFIILLTAIFYPSVYAQDTAISISIMQNEKWWSGVINEAQLMPYSSITKTSFNLSWTASTDNVGVTGYEVFRNGVYYGATTGTSLSITGLNCRTTYTMKVDAFDGASPPHNISALSAGKNVTTASCTSSRGSINGGTEITGDFKEGGISIYPNPAGANVTIDGIVSGAVINIINADAQTIYQTVAKSSKSKINISNFKPGLYVVKIAINGKINTIKLVKE